MTINLDKKQIYVVLDGPPETGRFYEIEQNSVPSRIIDAWADRGNGYWVLGPFIRVADAAEVIEQLRRERDEGSISHHPAKLRLDLQIHDLKAQLTRAEERIAKLETVIHRARTALRFYVEGKHQKLPGPAPHAIVEISAALADPQPDKEG